MPTPRIQALSRIPVWTAPLGLALALATTLFIYLNGLNGPFLFDDHLNLRMARIPTMSVDALLDQLHAFGHELLERPLSYLSFAATFTILGPDPVYFKAGNLFIHLVTGALLYPLINQLLALLAPDRPYRRRQSLAAFAAALWLLEPMHVSTVLYVVQRMAQLSALFVVLALLSYLAVRRHLPYGRRRRIFLYATCFITASALGIASKQDAVLIPVYILVIEIALHFSAHRALAHRATVWLVVLTSLFPIALGVAGALALHETLLGLYDRQPFTLTERLATEPRVLWGYARQLLLPRLSDFGLYANDVRVTDFYSPTTYIALIGWTAAVVCAFLLRHKSPIALLGILWYLAAHSLESSFLGLALAFEHRNYLAAVGVTVLVGELLTRWAHARTQYIMAFFALGLLALFSFQTWARVQNWSSELTIARTSVLENPNAARARSQYATILFKNGFYSDGVEQLRKGRRIAPHDSGFDVALLLVGCQFNRYRDALYDTALNALRNKKITPYTIGGLDILRKHKDNGECKEISKADAINLFNAALEGAEARTDDRTLARLYALRGNALAKWMDNYNKAIRDFRRASRLIPRWGFPWHKRIRLHLALGNIEKARAILNKVRDDFPFLTPLAPDTLRQLERQIDEADKKRSGSRDEAYAPGAGAQYRSPRFCFLPGGGCYSCAPITG